MEFLLIICIMLSFLVGGRRVKWLVLGVAISCFWMGKYFLATLFALLLLVG